MVSYTQRTLEALRKRGAVCGMAEHWNPFDHRRHDLFGFIDIVILEPGQITAIQSTGPNGHADHKRKILAEPRAKLWLEAGGRIELWSWRKLLVKRGGKAKRWTERVENITEEMFTQTDTEA
jgi:hypothetical protein